MPLLQECLLDLLDLLLCLLYFLLRFCQALLSLLRTVLQAFRRSICDLPLEDGRYFGYGRACSIEDRLRQNSRNSRGGRGNRMRSGGIGHSLRSTGQGCKGNFRCLCDLVKEGPLNRPESWLRGNRQARGAPAR